MKGNTQPRTHSNFPGFDPRLSPQEEVGENPEFSLNSSMIVGAKKK